MLFKKSLATWAAQKRRVLSNHTALLSGILLDKRRGVGKCVILMPCDFVFGHASPTSNEPIKFETRMLKPRGASAKVHEKFILAIKC